MTIFVKVTTNASRNEITQIDETNYKARVTASPVDGKANDAVIELLAQGFRIPRWRIRIVAGRSSRQKIIEIR